MNSKEIGHILRTKLQYSFELLKENFVSIGADVINWAGLVLINLSTVPTLIAILMGLTEKMPPVQLVLDLLFRLHF